MGYEKVLAKFDQFPIPDDAASQDELRRDFVKAVKLRRRLIFNARDKLSVLEDPPSVALLSKAPQAVRDLYSILSKVEVRDAAGPDHILLACSLGQRSPVRALRGLLTVAGFAAVTQLATGAEDPTLTRPLRGGITIGPGDWLDDFLYSPAVTGAYKLERECALYARIVVSPRLLDYLSAYIDNEAHSVEEKYHRSEAVFTRRLLFKDRDGTTALDFMGEAMRPAGVDATRIAGSAWKYVNDANAAARSLGNFHVASKYAWLIEYMRERLPLWGVQA